MPLHRHYIMFVCLFIYRVEILKAKDFNISATTGLWEMEVSMHIITEKGTHAFPAKMHGSCILLYFLWVAIHPLPVEAGVFLPELDK